MEPNCKMCRECGRMIIFLSSPSGIMPCNSFSVEVIPDIYGRMFYLGDNKVMRGRIAKSGESGAIKAWESHYAMCPNSRKSGGARKRKKKTKEEISAARKAAAEERDYVKALLLSRREEEWRSMGLFIK